MTYPFILNPLLTAIEIDAVSHYKDLIYPQYIWDYVLEDRDESIGIDCLMVNRILRGIIDISELSEADRNRFYYLMENINRAIAKSRVDRNFRVVKGIKEFDGLKSYTVGSTFTEGAFGSYTTSRSIATKYAGENDDGELLFYSQELNEGDYALYVDADEDEWIIGTDSKYEVIDIVHYEPLNFISEHRAKVFYLRRTM